MKTKTVYNAWFITWLCVLSVHMSFAQPDGVAAVMSNRITQTGPQTLRFEGVASNRMEYVFFNAANDFQEQQRIQAGEEVSKAVEQVLQRYQEKVDVSEYGVGLTFQSVCDLHVAVYKKTAHEEWKITPKDLPDCSREVYIRRKNAYVSWARSGPANYHADPPCYFSFTLTLGDPTDKDLFFERR